MDKLDKFTPLALAGDDKIVTRVDYQACDRCGFRLMRVETTIIGDQHLIVTRCPICVQFEKDDTGQVDTYVSAEDRLRYFDTWLATHGLSRNALEYHYRLDVEHFFDDEG
jgi:hypothetical protein